MNISFLVDKQPDIDFSEVIGQWGKQNQARLVKAFGTKGGWEVWAQIDLALFLSQKFPDMELEREQTVYTDSKKRADLVLKHKASGRKQLIELKVELNATNDLLTRFQSDIAKIQTTTKEVYSQAYAVAISQTPGCYQQLEAYSGNATAGRMPWVYSLTVGSKTGPAGLFMWKLHA